jgi:hypothetical protein
VVKCLFRKLEALSSNPHTKEWQTQTGSALEQSPCMHEALGSIPSLGGQGQGVTEPFQALLSEEGSTLYRWSLKLWLMPSAGTEGMRLKSI